MDVRRRFVVHEAQERVVGMCVSQDGFRWWKMKAAKSQAVNSEYTSRATMALGLMMGGIVVVSEWFY